jgi:small subunit ribosomal protein S8
MSLQDPISDMITRIRNAQSATLMETSAQHSKFKEEVLVVLKSNGYIKNFQISVQDKKKIITIQLKYLRDSSPCIKHIIRESKPSKRMYSSSDDMGDYLSGLGIRIISTSKGVMSDKEANRLKVGGEVICKVF